MSRDKQIEEMAKDLEIAFQLAGIPRFGAVAEVLVDTGYRKASDVVPKSEVNKELQAWADLYADSQSKWEKAYEELEIKLANAKSDVAREIFEEIEDICSDFPIYGNINTVILSERDLAFIKKKYTEGEG